MSESMHGIIHGRTIMLSQDPGIADGQEVEVVVRPVGPKRPWGEGIRRSAGALSDLSELDATMDEIQLQRKAELPREIAE